MKQNKNFLILTANKSTEKERSTPSRASCSDSRSASRCSSRASTTSSYLGNGANSFTTEYKDKEALSYRGSRAASLEPSSSNIKPGAYRVTYSRTPSFGRNSNSLSEYDFRVIILLITKKKVSQLRTP